MKAVDIPQADSLARIRELVQTVQFGAVDTARIQRVMTLHPRHVGYHLHAARVLNWLIRETEGWAVTPLGSEMLTTGAGSQEERAIFRKSISESTYLQTVAPNLLDDDEPEQDLLSKAIQDAAGIAPATARRRASTLLRWRTQSLPSRLRRFETRLLADDDDGQREHIRVYAVHAERYGLLRSVRVELGENSVFIGDNASGKSTVYDVLGFVADALKHDVATAIANRADEWRDLLWFGEGDGFGFAIEFSLPKAVRYDHAKARYELEIGQLDEGGVGVRRESLFLSPREVPPQAAIHDSTPRGWRKVMSLGQAGQARYGSEHPQSRKTTTAPVGTNALALSQLPDDGERFPAAGRIRQLFGGGLHRINLAVDVLRDSCASEGQPIMSSNGEGFGRVVHHLTHGPQDTYQAWLGHACEVVPGIEGVKSDVVDGQVVIRAVMRGGIELPIKRLSDGALKALALSALPHQPLSDALLVIESPESGVHPRCIGALSQALAVDTGPQIAVTTYSAPWVAAVAPDRLRCFTRDAGSIRVIPGAQLDLLAADTNLDMPVVFAAGMLG